MKIEGIRCVNYVGFGKIGKIGTGVDGGRIIDGSEVWLLIG